jgi:hypothetical protein
MVLEDRRGMVMCDPTARQQIDSEDSMIEHRQAACSEPAAPRTGDTSRVRPVEASTSRARAATVRLPGRRKGVRAALLVVSLLASALLLTACRGTHFENNDVGYFPPGTTYLGDWKYIAELYVETSDPGSMSVRQDKDVWIRVTDRVGVRLLDDKLSVRRCHVVARTTWERFDTLRVDLSEAGVQYTGKDAQYNDPYSVALARSGPRQFLTLRYRYNSEERVFERVE